MGLYSIYYSMSTTHIQFVQHEQQYSEKEWIFIQQLMLVCDIEQHVKSSEEKLEKKDVLTYRSKLLER